jgi:hypothetical protein
VSSEVNTFNRWLKQIHHTKGNNPQRKVEDKHYVKLESMYGSIYLYFNNKFCLRNTRGFLLLSKLKNRRHGNFFLNFLEFLFGLDPPHAIKSTHSVWCYVEIIDYISNLKVWTGAVNQKSNFLHKMYLIFVHLSPIYESLENVLISACFGIFQQTNIIEHTI